MDYVSNSGCTPRKYIGTAGCILCGCEKADPRKRTKLNGRVSDLQHRICSILDVPLTSINSDGYICNDRCYRDLNRLDKMKEDLKKLQNTLKEKFATNTRAKRAIPTDATISPSVVPPSKSLRHQLTDQARGKVQKRLSFEETQPTSNPVFIQPVVPVQLPLPMPMPPVSVQAQPSIENELVFGSAQFGGNICQVQVNMIKIN
jgi:hypothetical protein